ncbi:MAG: DUF1737 domain-containing protein [Alphaproteobacteria bacterium]|nr:DUF1737 domain-containing protein [Alphaproteobacteria bacterium]
MTKPQNDKRRKTKYHLLTGSDDKAFCECLSTALEEGYQL